MSSVLLIFFAAAHTIGFRSAPPEWRVDALVASMRSIHFNEQGFNRSYWDLYVGFGFFVTVFFLFSAVLAWQFAGLRPETLSSLRGPAWAFAICYVVVTILSWRFFFIAPIVCSGLVSICLIAAAWLSAKPAQ